MSLQCAHDLLADWTSRRRRSIVDESSLNIREILATSRKKLSLLEG